MHYIIKSIFELRFSTDDLFSQSYNVDTNPDANNSVWDFLEIDSNFQKANTEENWQQCFDLTADSVLDISHLSTETSASKPSLAQDDELITLSERNLAHSELENFLSTNHQLVQSPEDLRDSTCRKFTESLTSASCDPLSLNNIELSEISKSDYNTNLELDTCQTSSTIPLDVLYLDLVDLYKSRHEDMTLGIRKAETEFGLTERNNKVKIWQIKLEKLQLEKAMAAAQSGDNIEFYCKVSSFIG